MASFSKKNSGTSLATNWMVHVCIIIILIISFVLYDKISSRKPRSSVASGIPSANNTSYNSGRSAQPTTDNSQTVERAAPPKEPIKKIESKRAGSVKAASPSPSDSETFADSSTSPAGKEKRAGLQVSFYKISKQGIGELQKISQAISIAGDSLGGVLPSERVQQLVSSGEMQYVAGNRYKDFDEKHPTVVYKGQRHTEAARNMGIFFQVTSLRKSENSHLIEIKGWGALKVSEADENYFTGEMTLTPKNAAFVTGFLPRNSTFSEDEKQLFEADRVLKTLIQEDFVDGSTDLIMFIEFSKST